MKKYRLFEIVWDTDGEEVDLPSEEVIEVDEDFDVESEGADELSDKFGWLVKSFNFEEAN